MKKKECSARAMNAAMAVILCCATMLTACSTVWMNEAEQIVAVLIPAATNIIALVAAVQGNDVSAQDLQAVQNAGTQAGADLQLIQSLISQYESAGATAKPGLLSQIQTAITAVQANLNGILPALHIKDAATQGKVAAIVGMALSEVESLAAIVPLVNSNATPQMMAMSVQQAKNRVPLSAGDFVASYNATMGAKTGNAELDRAACGLRIHLHGKLVRWASVGMLK